MGSELINLAGEIINGLDKQAAISLMILQKATQLGSIEAALDAVLGDWRSPLLDAGLSIDVAQILEAVMRDAARGIAAAFSAKGVN